MDSGSNIDADVRDRQQVLNAELIRISHQTPLVAPLMSVPAGLAVLVLHVDKVAWPPMLAWMLLLLMAVSVRVGLLMYCRTRLPEDCDQPRWRWMLILAHACSGMVWGASSFMLFVPGAFSIQLATAAIVWGVTVFVTLSTAYLPAFRIYLLAAMLPYVVVFLQQQTSDYLATGAMMLVLLFITDVIASARQRIVRELTELRLQLMERKDAAEQANLAKSRFLAAASHDLRQPLHALTLYLGVLSSRLAASAEREIVGNMHKATDALQGLLGALLDISRLDAGAVEPLQQQVRVAPLIEHVFAEVDAQARAKGLELVTEACELTVRSDPALMETVLRHLIGNAVRYTMRGSVRVACRSDGPDVWLSVQDTGVGIAPEHQRKVFDEFFQVHNPGRDRSQGLGLGLAIVRRQLRLLGHELRLDSVAGQGSVFAIRLPRAMGTAATEESPRTDLDALEPVSGLRLLVIEDDELVRTSTRTLLEGWGMQVQTADGLAQARREVAAVVPDAIIADYRLGGSMNGAQVIRALHATLEREVPAILMTGDIAPESLREAAQCGLPVLHKPVAPAKLRAFVHRVQRSLVRPTA